MPRLKKATSLLKIQIGVLMNLQIKQIKFPSHCASVINKIIQFFTNVQIMKMTPSLGQKKQIGFSVQANYFAVFTKQAKVFLTPCVFVDRFQVRNLFLVKEFWEFKNIEQTNVANNKYQYFYDIFIHQRDLKTEIHHQNYIFSKKALFDVQLSNNNKVCNCYCIDRIKAKNQHHQQQLRSNISIDINPFAQCYPKDHMKAIFILFLYKGLYNLLLNRFWNQNAQMQNCIQTLLKNFYYISVQNHPDRVEKIRTLDSCFSKFDNTFKSTFENTKSNADGQYETQASIEDFEAFSFNRCQTHIYSSNMLGTFLLSNCYNQTTSNYKVISRNIFTDPSIIKVIMYALFINFLHINRKTDSIQNHKYLSYSLRFAQQTIKKLKIAMVTAAQSYKNIDKKRYSKIRYLYDQLIAYTEKSCILKQEYIKVIIEQFDNDFLKQTFKCLQSKWDQLLYSQSLDSVIHSTDSISREAESLEKVNRALQFLKVKMILLKDDLSVDDRQFNKNLNIVVEELPNGAYKLNEIISFRRNQSFIDE